VLTNPIFTDLLCAIAGPTPITTLALKISRARLKTMIAPSRWRSWPLGLAGNLPSCRLKGPSAVLPPDGEIAGINGISIVQARWGRPLIDDDQFR
jgi:hypothetical protein